MQTTIANALLAPFLRSRHAGKIAHLTWSPNWLTLNFIMLALVVLVGIAYVVVTNTVSTQGFAVKKLELRLEELTTQHAQLTVSSAELQSLDAIRAAAASLNLTDLARVQYVPGSHTVASR